MKIRVEPADDDLGFIPEGWTARSLGELCDVRGRIGWRGYTVHDIRESGPLVIGPTQISAENRLDFSKSTHISREKFEESPEIKIDQWDILVVKVGNTIGKVAAVIEDLGDACINPNTVLLKRIAVEPRFLFYYLTSSYAQHFLRANSAASAQPAINQTVLKTLRVLVPPPSEARAIAHILGTLEDKIELNRRMNETLEAIARAIFKSWFVDFDPVRANAEGRQPVGMDADTAALFSDSFEESRLGKVPSGWCVSSIGDMVRVVGGSTPSTEEATYWAGGTIPFVTPKDLADLDDPVLLDTERHITERGLERISSGLLPPGSVLLSSRAPIGYLAITEVPVAVNQGFIAMICDGPLPNYYVIHWARQNMDTLVANANGTTFLEISKKSFRPISVLVPPKRLLESFAQSAATTHALIVNNIRESHTLAAIRDALLPRLLSGDIRVKDAEKLVGAAT